MKIDFEGKTRSLDLDRIRLKQGEKIQAYTGLPIQKWAEALGNPEHTAFLKSYAALYWLMLAQNDEATGVGIADVDFELTVFDAAFDAANKAEQAAAARAEAAVDEPDPTRSAAASEPSSEPPSRTLKASGAGAGEKAPDG